MSNVRAINAQVLKDLSERHPDEFHQMMTEAYAEAGREYKPRLAPEERVEARRLKQVAKVQAKIAEAEAELAALNQPLP